eukprot:TRINITY_DN6598_c0_g1_i1.p1 TRINITY_DN6598_c0_g1~~TRINITY_DN6598_c0_g1_i1.p1  ORF type:complete len:386 (-),score=66.90 TRINITY_DN6598_c0_g1_i1:35-1192(-)
MKIFQDVATSDACQKAAPSMAHRQFARFLYDRNQIDGALHHMTVSVRKNDSDSLAQHYLGKILIRAAMIVQDRTQQGMSGRELHENLEKYHELLQNAHTHLVKSVELSPDNCEFVVFLGEYLAWQSRFDEVVRVLEPYRPVVFLPNGNSYHADEMNRMFSTWAANCTCGFHHFLGLAYKSMEGKEHLARHHLMHVAMSSSAFQKRLAYLAPESLRSVELSEVDWKAPHCGAALTQAQLANSFRLLAMTLYSVDQNLPMATTSFEASLPYFRASAPPTELDAGEYTGVPAEVLNDMALLYLAQGGQVQPINVGLVKKALQMFRSVTKRAPRHVGAHFNMGQAYEVLGDHKRAVSAYEKAISYSSETGVPPIYHSHLERARRNANRA